MSQLTQLNEQQRILTDDLRASIRYTPNREADLLAFMRLYIKEDTERRPAILDSLRRCMDGQPYPNPYAGQRSYTVADVEQFDGLLTDFLKNLSNCAGNKLALECQTDCLLDGIDQLNERCGFGLLDNWRRQKLFAFLDSAEALVMDSAGPAIEMR